jgi:hypothetical protein
MGDLGIHLWSGQSGQKYRYTVYMFGTAFGPGPANFIFARETRPGQYQALYVGQTQDLSEPFDDPVALECLKQGRATHIHVRHSDAREEIRRAERSDLISACDPPCNAMR